VSNDVQVGDKTRQLTLFEKEALGRSSVSLEVCHGGDGNDEDPTDSESAREPREDVTVEIMDADDYIPEPFGRRFVREVDAHRRDHKAERVGSMTNMVEGHR